MLDLALLALAPLQVYSEPPKIEAPPPVARTSAVEDLTDLSITDLVRRQPHNPWDRSEWGKLLPEVLELMHRAGSGKWSDDDWRTALTASDMIHTRSKWPAGAPLQIAIGSQGWLRLSKITVRAVEPDLGEVSFDDLVPSTCGNCQDADEFRAQHLSLAPFPAATARVMFEITIIQDETPEHVWGDPEKSGRVLWKGRMERSIQAVPTASDVIPATSSPQDTSLVRKSLKAFWSTATADPDELIIFVTGTPARGLGLSLTIELWSGDEQIKSGSLVAYTQRGLIEDVERCSGYTNFPGLSAKLRGSNVDLSKWELRVRGDPSGVPGIWDADRWWNGSFSIPLTEALKKSE